MKFVRFIREYMMQVFQPSLVTGSQQSTLESRYDSKSSEEQKREDLLRKYQVIVYGFLSLLLIAICSWLFVTFFNVANLVGVKPDAYYDDIVLMVSDALYIGIAILVAIYLLDQVSAKQQAFNDTHNKNHAPNDFYTETNKHLDRMIWRLSFFEKFWITFGLICVVGAGYCAWLAYDDTRKAIEIGSEASPYLHYILLVKGVFLTGIPAALATYSFRISRAYIHERLKRQERKHAINFGKLILTKFNIKEVPEKHIGVNELVNLFQWNIANDTAFSKHDYNKIESEMLNYWHRTLTGELNKDGDSKRK